MRYGTLLAAALLPTVATCVPLAAGAGAATSWVVGRSAGSSGEAQALALPAAPTGVSDTCNAPTTSKTIRVSWSAVARATTYSVYDSTTSATGTYSLLASGVTATSWTSGTLTAGTHYWFEVVAVVGSNWSSTRSSATVQSTINAVSPFCTQP